MIKDLTFAGKFIDENLLRVEAILANPTKHGYSDDIIGFEIRITMGGKATTELDKWTFYIVSGQNRIYNAENVTEIPCDGMSTINLIVAYKFRTEYLYNDIRLGFLYKPYNCIDFIEISH